MFNLTPCGRRFYLAVKAEKPVGVFSSQEKAQAAGCDSLTEIEPYLLESSPASEEYLCMVSGCCTLLRRNEEGFSTEVLDVGPLWGLNPQSAAAYLARTGGRSVQCDQFCLFRIDQEYAPGKPDSLHRNGIFSGLVQSFAFDELRGGKDVIVDYIELYFSNMREAQAAAAKASLPEVGLITDFLMKVACKRAADRGGWICGTPLSKQKEALRHSLLHEFSTEELGQLAALLKLTEPPEGFTLPEETAQKLLHRAEKHIPHVMSFGRRLKDCLD